MRNRNPTLMASMRSFMSHDGSIAYSTGANGRWERFTSDRWCDTHHHHKTYIRLIAEQNPDKKIVVITHHAPLTILHEKRYAMDFGNPYFSSDLSDLILDHENIKYWFYGHLHYPKVTKFDHCTLINNSVGYLGEGIEEMHGITHLPYNLEDGVDGQDFTAEEN